MTIRSTASSITTASSSEPARLDIKYFSVCNPELLVNYFVSLWGKEKNLFCVTALLNIVQKCSFYILYLCQIELLLSMLYYEEQLKVEKKKSEFLFLIMQPPLKLFSCLPHYQQHVKKRQEVLSTPPPRLVSSLKPSCGEFYLTV